MNITLISNQIRTQITPLKRQYNDKIDREESVQDVNVRIRIVVQDGFSKIEKYLTANPITKEELSVLQIFRNELEEVDELTSDIGLSKFNHLIENILFTGVNRAYFQSKSNWQERVAILLDKFQAIFVGKIRDSINKQIFFNWNQKLRFQSSLENIVKLNERIERLGAKIANDPENQKLESQLKQAKAQLQRTESFVSEYKKNLVAGAAVRKQLVSIGGTRVALQTKDNEVLDGAYLSVQGFQQKCLEAGASHAKIQILIEKDKQSEITGITFSKGENADQFLKTLDQLKLFKDFSPESHHQGAGWAKINIGDQVVIVPDFEIEHLLEKKLITDNSGTYSFLESISDKIKLDKNPLEINAKESGTVVMGMGAAGVYEMAKRETIFLLMQGINVMLFNHRGNGKSTGKPSEKGVYEDMETIYHYLKNVHNIEDNKLVLRGLCLSGGIVAKLAANHPQTNIILDQTYADVSDIALNTVLDSAKDLLNYDPEEKSKVKEVILSILKPILKTVTSLVCPDFSTTKHLNKIKGKTLILRSTEDTYTNREMTDKIVNKYAKTTSDNGSQIRIGHMPGIHGSNWLDARKSYGDHQQVNLGRYHIVSFLKEAGALNPFVDQENTLNALSINYYEYLEQSVSTLKAGSELSTSKEVEGLPRGFNEIPLEIIQGVEKTQTTEVPQLANVIDGKRYFDPVLNELNRLKEKLGGSPTFGSSLPRMDENENRNIFLNLSMAHLKDWFRMVLRKQWSPHFFWKAIAKVFQVTEENQQSQYEEAHLSIQRFGMLIANKERFFEILRNQEANRYIELGIITGLAWHPQLNEPGIEKIYNV